MEDRDAKAGRAQDYKDRQKDVRAELYERIKSMELSGELYPTTVEIVLPPGSREKYGIDGIVLDTFDVLNWPAADLQSENPNQAQFYRDIAEDIYKNDDEDEDDDDRYGDIEVDMDTLEGLVAEMEQEGSHL